jgi:hypothetical protein
MNGPASLEEHVGRLKTRMGAFFPGDRVVFRGHDLHASLKDMDWLELFYFGITGRRYSPKQLKVLHALWTYTSYPDPRLWNNRVAALAGAARSTSCLGVSAALAVSEATIYGGIAELRACEFITRARSQVDAGADLKELIRSELKQKRVIAGYGRPIVSEDERIVPLMALVSEQGFDKGPHIKLAFEVETILQEGRWRMRMNYVGLSSALCADLGMSPREYYYVAIPAFFAGMPPCNLDAAEKPEGQLFPLPCRMLSYEGVARRRWRDVAKSA